MFLFKQDKEEFGSYDRGKNVNRGNDGGVFKKRDGYAARGKF